MVAQGYTDAAGSGGGGGVAGVASVNGRTGVVTLTKTDVGLGNVDNTADTAKPVSTAQATADGLRIAGPASSTDRALVRYSGTGGKTALDSLVLAADDGALILTPLASSAYAAGKLFYDSVNQCLTFFNNDNQISMQVGQELWLMVRNVTGSTIANGAAVYIVGADSGLPSIAPANASALATAGVVGMATEAIVTATAGYVTLAGVVNGLDTSALTLGTAVFASATTPGALTSTAPAAPNFRARVGTVVAVSPTVGKIAVAVTTPVVGFGSANQLIGMNAAGTAQEYKSLNGTASQITVTQAANAVTLSIPSAAALPGAPTTTTPTGGDNTTKIATTAYVVTALGSYAPLASPTFTGTPTAPTAAAATSTTQLATTAFVTTADNLKAPLASPTFTGTPAAPTPAALDSSTKIATTAYADAADAVNYPMMKWNGTSYIPATGAKVYVGAGTPSSPADGSVWLTS